MLKLISTLFSYLKKEMKIQVISEILFSNYKKAKRIRFIPEILFSYLKDKKKVQVISEILFSYFKNKKKIRVLSGVLFLLLIIILFSIRDTSDSQNGKEKKSTQFEEKNNYKSDGLTKNTEVKIGELKNKQTAQDDVSKPLKPSEKKDKKDKKALAKKQSETQQKNKAKQLKKPENKNEIKNSVTPMEVVNNLHIGLVKISKKSSDSPNDLINLVKNTYNTEKMIAKIIGDSWKKANKKDQKEIVIIFQEYIAKNYFKRFNKIKNPTFNFKESKKIGEKLMLVKTVLVVNKEEVSINYLLLLDKNKWRIFDVLLAGSISEIATKKSEFSSFIRDGKISPLIDALKKQNSVLNY